MRIYENYHANIKLNDKDKTIRDTRVANPFQALQNFVDQIDLENMSEIDHKHIPYIVLLIKGLYKFRIKHNRNPYNNKTEKEEFKNYVLEMKKYLEEENFDQALTFIYDVTNEYLEVKFCFS